MQFSTKIKNLRLLSFFLMLNPNTNEENRDDNMEEIPLVSSKDILLAIEKVNLFVEQRFKEFTNEELKLC